MVKKFTTEINIDKNQDSVVYQKHERGNDCYVIESWPDSEVWYNAKGVLVIKH